MLLFMFISQYLPTYTQTTTTQGGHAVGGEEQLFNPENADGKSITVEEKTAQLTHKVGKFCGTVFQCLVNFVWCGKGRRGLQ